MWIPFLLTIIFVSVGLLLTLILAWGVWRHRNPPPASEDDLPKDVKDFGPAATNRWVKGLRVFLLLLIVTVFGFHSYWVFFADSKKDNPFSKAKRLDARNLRLAESGLKGCAGSLGQT